MDIGAVVDPGDEVDGHTRGMAGEQVVVTRPDGAKLWSTRTGTGQGVIWCHGGPGLWDYLEPVATGLDDVAASVRFDQRGCGRSSGAPPYSLAQAVDDLDAVRAAHGLDRVVVVGHSYGAELAIRYAAAHPDRVVSVGYVGGTGPDDAFQAAYARERDRRLGDVAAVRLGELSTRPLDGLEERERCLLQWAPDFSPSGDPAGHAAALWATRPRGATVNAAANRQLQEDRRRRGDLLGLAANVRCPVLIVHGADDPRPWSATDSLLAALPDAQRLVIAGAGHAPWAERPEETRRALGACSPAAAPPGASLAAWTSRASTTPTSVDAPPTS